MEHYTIPKGICPKCKTPIDTVTEMNDLTGLVERKGGYTICIECMTLLRMNAKLEHRLVTTEERRKLPEHMKRQIEMFRLGIIDLKRINGHKSRGKA